MIEKLENPFKDEIKKNPNEFLLTYQDGTTEVVQISNVLSNILVPGNVKNRGTEQVVVDKINQLAEVSNTTGSYVGTGQEGYFTKDIFIGKGFKFLIFPSGFFTLQIASPVYVSTPIILYDRIETRIQWASLTTGSVATYNSLTGNLALLNSYGSDYPSAKHPLNMNETYRWLGVR